MGRKVQAKTKTPSINSLKKKVWKEFSKYIRLKYSCFGMVRCYTCDTPLSWREAQCGHGLGGRYNSILFDEELCRPQCIRCNIFLGGNYDVFHAKLIKENGIKWFEKKLKQKNTPKQFTIPELEKLYEHYKKLVQEYENGTAI